MEKLNIANHKQWGRHLTSLGMACAIGLGSLHFSSLATAQESLVQKELNRRIENARKANELLQQGDISYNSKDYKAAVSQYSQAFKLLPGGSRNDATKAAAADRYATAATERSRQLAKNGDYEQAKQLLDQVLQTHIAPTHIAAIKLRKQIDDPLRYNPALDPEHVDKAQQVGILLRKAEGYYNLGQYDQSLATYNQVLIIDSFNKAARRGMEKVESVKSDYYRAARDQTRSELLTRVDQAWETTSHQKVTPPRLPGLDTSLGRVGFSLRDKLAGIKVDAVNLDNASLAEALDFIRVQSRLGDIPSLGGEKTGINIVLNLGDGESEVAKLVKNSRVDLQVRDLPLSKVLDYITDQTHTQWRDDGASVIISPLGSTDETIVSRSFRVPPNFLASASARKDDGGGDIFTDNNDNQGGLIPQKVSITEFLKSNGISFPEGASASYQAGNNTLLVRNTASNIDMVQQLVDIISDEEPVQVVIKTTIMRISEDKLKALNFDWLISPADFGQNLFMGGGTVGNGSALNDMPLYPFSGLGSPITSGTRSGSTGLHTNSLDTFLAAGTSAFGSTEIRSPGILTVTGVYSGFQFQMMMRGLDQSKGTDIVTKPSMVTRSGQRAKFEAIREFIYPTEYEPPELPNSVTPTITETPGGGTLSFNPITPAMPTAFERRDVGVTLEVEPTVGPDKKYIELSLNPELVEFQGFVNYGGPITSSGTDILGNPVYTIISDNRILMPVFNVIRLNSQTVTIQDGATIVLGGVMTSRKSTVEDKVPFLGDIPYAGRLFRSEAEQTFNQAVIITVQAELVDPTGTPWNQR